MVDYGGMSIPISGFQRPLYAWTQESIDKVETRGGVFEFYDQYEMIIFIGASDNMKETIQQMYNSGFADKPCLNQTTHFRVEPADKPELAFKNHMIVFKSTSGGQPPECMQ